MTVLSSADRVRPATQPDFEPAPEQTGNRFQSRRPAAAQALPAQEEFEPEEEAQQQQPDIRAQPPTRGGVPRQRLQVKVEVESTVFKRGICQQNLKNL